MADHIVTLTVSDEVYEYARQLAETSEQPIEAILQRRLSEMLPSLPADEEAELTALKLLSDDALRTIAAEQMPRHYQERLSELLRLNGHGAITDQEQTELDSLMERGDRLMVRKAEAAGLLTERGYKVTPQDLAAKY